MKAGRFGSPRGAAAQSPRPSLLMAGSGLRLAAAAVLIAVMWAAVGWARGAAP